MEQHPPNIRPIVNPQLTIAGKADCMAIPVKAIALDTVIFPLGSGVCLSRASLASISLVPGGKSLFGNEGDCWGPRRRAEDISFKLTAVTLDLRLCLAMMT